MRKIILVIGILLVGLGTGPAHGQRWYGTPEGRTISVSGQAAIKVVPDEVELIVGIEVDDLDLKIAETECKKRLAAALATTRQFKIPPEKVATDYVSVEPRWTNRNDPRRFLGYWVRRTLVITLRDLSQFDSLLSNLLEAGVTHVHEVRFRTTELRRHRDEARRLAARAAREKGDLLARELGTVLGEVISIREERVGSWSGYGARWGRRWDTAGMQNTVSYGPSSAKPSGTLSPGEISVEATVAVIFRLATPEKPTSP